MLIAWIPCISHAQAPTPQRPAYTLERHDENWSFLRDPSKGTDFFDPIKWIPLGKNASWFLTLGGELRERFQDVRNPAFALPSAVRNTDFFHRTFLFGDVHLGPHFRTFVELVNGVTAGTTKKKSSFEQDSLDVLQAFADVVVPAGKNGDFTLRIGRQDMMFGSSRLVSLREAPNVRRAFDGVRIFWKAANGKRADAFLVRPVTPQFGVFDDSRDRTQLFWGVYITSPIPRGKGAKADLYYLGLDRLDAVFARGRAQEHRHTVGARLFGNRTGFDLDEEIFNFDSRRALDVESKFDWDVEGAYQFGSFGAAEIGAWMISSNWGYTFTEFALSPRAGLKADAASGDTNLQDQRLGTFNPLFPALRYYSLVRLFEPANLLNLQPSITVDLSKNLNASVAGSALWRVSMADAFYAPPLVLVNGTATNGRFIGQQASAILAWKATVHLTIGFNYAHFIPGGSVKQAGGHSGDFFLALGQFKF
ncbi:MAG TPA: alginate export family protein [Candidatus Dormibacteraeota bacterium]|nr:alginate export family protein [Candidatus Dormibacteraeota bacterium]